MSTFSEAYAAWRAVRARLDAMNQSIGNTDAEWTAALDAYDEAAALVIGATARDLAEVQAKVTVLADVIRLWNGRDDWHEGPLVESLQRDLERLAN